MGGRQFRGFALAALVLVILGAVLYAFIGFPTSPEDANFDTSGPRIVALSALAIVFIASLLFGQPKVRDILKAVVFWGGLMAVLVTGYAYKSDLIAGGYRVLGALAPGLAVNQQDGTILVVRDAGGHFHLDANVEGTPVRFLLDTGASAVVLTYEDAMRIGLSPDTLSFSVPVATANGRTVVAPVRLRNITVGDARMQGVRSYVARDGSLETSLFGMSALDRLQTWRIEGDRLIMTP